MRLESLKISNTLKLLEIFKLFCSTSASANEDRLAATLALMLFLSKLILKLPDSIRERNDLFFLTSSMFKGVFQFFSVDFLSTCSVAGTK